MKLTKSIALWENAHRLADIAVQCCYYMPFPLNWTGSKCASDSSNWLSEWIQIKFLRSFKRNSFKVHACFVFFLAYGLIFNYYSYQVHYLNLYISTQDDFGGSHRAFEHYPYLFLIPVNMFSLRVWLNILFSQLYIIALLLLCLITLSVFGITLHSMNGCQWLVNWIEGYVQKKKPWPILCQYRWIFLAGLR